MKTTGIIIFIFLSSLKSFSQNQVINSIPKEGVVLNSGWKFQAGDNMNWANPEYDDKNWKSIDPTLDVHDLPQLHKSIHWFRLRLSIDSGVLENQLALIIRQSGASEFYLNGRLIHRFGVFSTIPEEIVAYDPLDKPISFPLDKTAQYVLAVRYVLQPNVSYITNYVEQHPVLQIRVNNIDTAIDQYKSNSNESMWLFRAGVFFILTILHLAYYLYYPPQKANLYFFLYACLLTVDMLVYSNVPHELKYWFYVDNINVDLVLIGTFLMLTANYVLLRKKRGIIFWTLLALVIIGIPVNYLAIGYHGFIYSATLLILMNVDVIRIAFLAIKNKQRGAWIIVLGAVCFLICWVIGFLPLLFNLDSTQLLLPEGVQAFILNFSFLSIPIATSIYLGLDFAFTSVSLKQKLGEVEKLSEEKQQILASQNETLERQVTQRTAELQHSLKELNATQAQLIQSEKMASLGELTAGIAHEIKNPLNFVNNFSEVNIELIEELEQEIDKENLKDVKVLAKDIKENQQKINLHGKRADAIVKSMLQHSRTSSGQKEPTDINTLTEEYLRLAYHGLRAKNNTFNATVKTDFDKTIGEMNIIPQDIGRVILNLITNAFYAVTEKNIWTTAAEQPYEPTVSVSTKLIEPALGGLSVFISVKDNGSGIPQKILDKIFQPFFTTKPAGQGTGLGLSLSYDIVKAHGGEITVKTNENEGTEFIIQLSVQ
jgi:signal transduction histidine kinase